jgi:hypothetical protein
VYIDLDFFLGSPGNFKKHHAELCRFGAGAFWDSTSPLLLTIEYTRMEHSAFVFEPLQ